MDFITLGKKRADGDWVLLKGPPHGLQAQRAYVDGIGVSDPTYSEARIIELGIGQKRIFYSADETVTVTALNKTITYGANKPSSFAVTWSKNIPDTYYTGTLSTACAYTKGNNAGTYPIAPSGLTATDKYAIAFVAGTLTVSKVALTLTVANAQMVEGGAAPAFSFTGTGFVNDEDVTDLTGSAVYTVKNNLGETVADLTTAAPGEYEVHLSGVTSSNYELTRVAGTLTITENGS
ncbi:MAG: MBG domain-containing protein [Saccharofermentanales bacterium]